ncbi:MAG: MFS transporter [Chitinophagales bacterium]
MQYSKSIFTAGVIVAALGYFVDIYDLLLFSIVRVPSLSSMGYSPAEIEKYGLLLINTQMTGMLLGGIFWGMLGDKKGRLSVLFGSIVLYSVANILNGFANDVTTYAIFRFIAGVGLAGELGAGITLVAESLPKEKRGYGTMLVASIGVSGAVFAGQTYRIMSHLTTDAWRNCYFLGGALGLALLILRIGVYESGIFQKVLETETPRGQFLKLFRDWPTFLKYVRCVLIGLPTWFAIGILVTFSPEFSQLLHIKGVIKGGDAIMYTYAGITAGDFLCGYLSQMLRSRKKAVFLFLALTALGFVFYFNADGFSARWFYAIMVFIGVGTGFWAVIITNAAEQFGTNIRATVATTVPNFIRGSLPLIALFYTMLQSHFTKLHAAALVGFVIIVLPMLALYFTEETFGKDLDYTE